MKNVFLSFIASDDMWDLTSVSTTVSRDLLRIMTVLKPVMLITKIANHCQVQNNFLQMV